ncbi:hypothetical protein D3870_04785 [Noviherbaspirillum cavernae]|uniref:Uncharacterized protein n=1 Tax=Noviherbaspirillum cavernae TaxID=2320862 RepID=A0A418WYU2_9BURK|nr:hypothetical protein [Noviherbaspirillum cavernae]RJG05429.1 hypothetical protein D3870_04785 [Noviherbaspirillum cavernae]
MVLYQFEENEIKYKRERVRRFLAEFGEIRSMMQDDCVVETCPAVNGEGGRCQSVNIDQAQFRYKNRHGLQNGLKVKLSVFSAAKQLLKSLPKPMQSAAALSQFRIKLPQLS